jgi:hypothetical protein
MTNSNTDLLQVSLSDDYMNHYICNYGITFKVRKIVITYSIQVSIIMFLGVEGPMQV